MTYLSAGSPESGLGVPPSPAMRDAGSGCPTKSTAEYLFFLPWQFKAFSLGWFVSPRRRLPHFWQVGGARQRHTITHPPQIPCRFSWLLLPPLQLSILEPEPESLPAAISQIFLMSSINIICWPLSPLYSLPPSVSSANCPGKLSRSPSQPAQAQAQAQQSHPFTQPEIATTIWGDQAGDSTRVPALSHAFV